ncbi:hypothetical protein PRIPAC_71192, partial [Pristionchus pacificus]|uniref:Uncharacterized protein n=1 Tax=Pristionchus pacificus TaxID=54126 RepID=A0A2A6CF26_PRIPA
PFIFASANTEDPKEPSWPSTDPDINHAIETMTKYYMKVDITDPSSIDILLAAALKDLYNKAGKEMPKDAEKHTEVLDTKKQYKSYRKKRNLKKHLRGYKKDSSAIIGPFAEGPANDVFERYTPNLIGRH